MISWLVYCLLVAALVSAAAWLLERALRSAGRPGRWAWVFGLLATVALPLWAWLAPAPAPSGDATPVPSGLVVEALPVLTAPPAAGFDAGPLVLDLWLAATALLLLWLGVSALRLWSAARRWRDAELDGVPVLVSPRTGPAAMGVLRGRVVVPEWALELDGRRRRMMVLHEAEHVRAGDPRLALAGLVLCALMPWNLPAWWQFRRLRLAIEMDCDARVLRRVGDRHGYGSLLLEMCQRRPNLALGLAETRSSLERRIRMMTETTTGRATLRGLVAVALAGVVLAVACETPAPVEVADPEQQPVALDDARTASVSMDGCEPLVYVDGEEGERSDLEALNPDDIDAIEVHKGALAEAAGRGCGVLWVTTKAASPEAREQARRLMDAFRRDAAPAPRTEAELSEAPVFTPMTQRPMLTNAEAVTQALTDYYPPRLRDAGIGGTANVWFFIDAEGNVARTMVNQTSGHDALDEAALRVAAEMEFSPARLEEEPVPVWVALDIRFETEG